MYFLLTCPVDMVLGRGTITPPAQAPGSSRNHVWEEGPHCGLLRPPSPFWGPSHQTRCFLGPFPCWLSLHPQGHDARVEFLTHQDAFCFLKCRDLSPFRRTWAQIPALTLLSLGPLSLSLPSCEMKRQIMTAAWGAGRIKGQARSWDSVSASVWYWLSGPLCD